MTASQVYENNIKPLSAPEKLLIAQLILSDLSSDITPSSQPLTGQSDFENLRKMLPTLERISFSDDDLASISISGLMK